MSNDTQQSGAVTGEQMAAIRQAVDARRAVVQHRTTDNLDRLNAAIDPIRIAFDVRTEQQVDRIYQTVARIEEATR